MRAFFNGQEEHKVPVGGISFMNGSDHRRELLEYRIRQGIRERRLGTALDASGPPQPRYGGDPATGRTAEGKDAETGGPATARTYAAWVRPDDPYGLAFETDLVPARALAAEFEITERAAQEARGFVIRATRAAAGELGLAQFVDIGAGLPLIPTVHATARGIRPSARVVYADADNEVTMQTGALLARVPGVAAITGDVRDPGAIFTHPELAGLVDMSRPVCVLLGMVLHFVPPDQAREATAAIVNRLAPGSAVIMSVGIATQDVVDAFRARGIRGYAHTPGHVAAYFEGLAPLLEPGLVKAREWRPEVTETTLPPADIRAGVGVKR
jgi:hypothetical protein